MDIREAEGRAVAEAVLENEMEELTDLQLAFVGGGSGETSL